MRIRHTKSGEHIDKLNSVTKAFMTSIIDKVPSFLLKFPELTNNINNPNLNGLLLMRKKLLSSVKEGMLEREDKEEEIAALAGVIWFCRQEEARRHKVLNY